jgi:hypothetical protein
MTLAAKLTELRDLMKYYELVGRDREKTKWILRNTTDEGLGHGSNRVKFEDEDLERMVDRALSYAKNGPDKEVLKAAEEVTVLFKRRTLIQGDIISVIIRGFDDSEIEDLESKMQDMQWKYGRYDLEPFYLGDETDEEK